MRRLLALLLLAILPLPLACTEGAPEEIPKARAAAPARILTLAPSVTEIAFALGLGDRVVGVGDYVLWPPEAAGRPRLGGLINPNLEAMVRLEPDLAILLPSEEDIARSLRRLNIEVLTVESESLADLEAAVVTIGRRCSVPARGAELKDELHEALAPRDDAAGRSVMITLGRPLGRPAEVLVAGPGTFYNELLERLGAANAFQDARALYPQISLEQVLARSPDVILEIHTDEQSAQQVAQRQEDWAEALRSLAALAPPVRVISGDWALIPGPRLPRLYRAMAEALAAPPSSKPGPAKVSP